MSADDNMTDWAEGQPPPWLTSYGPVPPAVDDSLAGAPGAPQVAPGPAMPPLQPGLGMPASAVDGAAQRLAEPALAPAVAPASAQPSPVPPLASDPSRLGAPGFGAIPESAIPQPTQQQPPQQPPWLQGPPDAISGANASAPASEARNPTQDLARIASETADSNAQIAVDPNADIGDRQRAWQQLPPGMRASIVNSADPKQLAAVATAAMSPEELATISIRHEQAKVHEQVAQQLELSRKTAEEAQHNWEARQAAYQKANADTAQLEAEAKALSQQKIDPNEHGVGHFIASVLLSAIGGAMSQYTGGRNLALEELDKKTQARIDAQKADIANQWQGVNFKRNLIDEQYQRSGDLYRAQEAYRISQYDRAIGELQTKLQDYDPQGTTVLRGAQAVQQIQAQRAQALQAFAQQTFKNQIDAAKVDFDRIKAAQEAQQKAAELAQQERSSQRSAYTAQRGQDITAKTAADELAERRLDRQAKTDLAAQKDWEERGLADPATGEPMVTAEGAPMLAKARELAASGDVSAAKKLRDAAALQYGVKVGDKAEAPKLQKMIANAQGLSDNVAQIEALLDSDPGMTNRAAWAQLGTMFEHGKVQDIRALDMNASSREMEAFHDQFGDSPDEITTRLKATGGQAKLRARLEAVRDGLIQDVDAQLKAAKVVGGWKPVPLKIDAVTATPAGALQQQSLDENPNPLTTTQQVEQGLNTASTGATALIPGVGPTLAGAKWLWDKRGGGGASASEIRQENIRRLAAMATSQAVEARDRDDARAALAKVATDGLTKTERDLAAAMLAGASMPRPEPEETR